ncbi:MAG: glutamate--tRNA ligase [Gammaproteobacteria bacterium]|nr:glutamate--tRNA ligase [Gammaproteobacteria bacterium]
MIRTRFSPSPTGMLHLGNVRAALFSALFAKKSDGHFILRIEDTDAARSELKYAEILQEDLKWLGIHWQEGPGIEGPNGPYWQSKRADIYAKYYLELEERNLAYPCFCSDQELALNRKIQLSRGQPPRYPGTCRNLTLEQIEAKIAEGKKPALRFLVPLKKAINFEDTVKGPQHFNSDDIGDFIIRRAEGTASFMFCNAIDDALMKVTHVLRGEDHLANTPRQLMILDALQLHTPQYGHLSLITGDDGTPLSKRHGSFSLHDLHEQGYLARAVLNYLARLSHTYDSQKLLCFSDLAKNFHLEKISKASARFDKAQLLHWQKEAVMAQDKDASWEWLGKDIKKAIPESLRDLFVEAIVPNICFPKEANEWVDILFGNQLQFNDAQLAILKEAGEPFFIAVLKSVEAHGADLKRVLEDLKTELHVSGKKLFMPVRVALTGQEHGPELLQVVGLLGKEKMQLRFDYALDLVRKNNADDL